MQFLLYFLDSQRNQFLGLGRQFQLNAPELTVSSYRSSCVVTHRSAVYCAAKRCSNLG